MTFQLLLGIVAAISGAVASVAGFGIGSLITPLLAIKTGTGIAIAEVSIVHFCGNAFRFLFYEKILTNKFSLVLG